MGIPPGSNIAALPRIARAVNGTPRGNDTDTVPMFSHSFFEPRKKSFGGEVVGAALTADVTKNEVLGMGAIRGR
jgi:hypothetical protein